MIDPDVEQALQEAVAKYAMPARATEKAARTAQKAGAKLVLRAKKTAKPVKYGLVKKSYYEDHDPVIQAINSAKGKAEELGEMAKKPARVVTRVKEVPVLPKGKAAAIAGGAAAGGVALGAGGMALRRKHEVSKGVPGGAKAWVAAGKPHWTQQHGATYTVRRVQAAAEGKDAAKAIAQRRLSDGARSISRGLKQKRDAMTGNPFRQGRMTTAAQARKGDVPAQRRLGGKVPGYKVLP